jgi:hypothetical protein
MKKITLLFTGLLLMGIANAQSNKEEIDLMQSVFGMEKKAMVADFLKVEATKADAFWKLYDEYEVSRKELGVNRINMLEKYANNYKSMSPETADALLKDMMTNAAATDKLIVTYTNKVKKITDPITAFKFYHVENYILTSIRTKILEEIPFVEARK